MERPSVAFTPEIAMSKADSIIACIQAGGGEDKFEELASLLCRIKKRAQDEDWLTCYAYVVRRHWNMMSGTDIADVPSSDEVDALVEEFGTGDPLFRGMLAEAYPAEEKAQQVEAATHTPQEYLERLRAEGISDKRELAARLDEYFTDDRHISDAKLGELLPASAGVCVGYDGRRSRGRRLRKKM